MAAPIGGGDLVFDQRIHRGRIGHAQQRFGQTHQRDAFVGRQAIFGQEHLHQTGLGGAANLGDQVCAVGRDGCPRRGCKGGFCQVLGDKLCLIGQAFMLDAVPRCHQASPLL